MTNAARFVLCSTAIIGLVLPRSAGGQAAKPEEKPVSPLYQKETPLAVTFTADLRRIRADKDTNAPWRGGTIAYQSDTGRIVPMIWVLCRPLNEKSVLPMRYWNT